MKRFNHPSDLQKFLQPHRSAGQSIGFVPTMGALHEGHEDLVRRCREENDIVVTSIFVNPTQFNDPQDLEQYPRDTEGDCQRLEVLSCDAVFIPGVATMYPAKPLLSFHFGHLDEVMEGKYRPGHFNGVAIVVSKLFNMVRPHRAYFGQKDYQQYRIIEQLNRDLSFDIDIVCCDIVREQNGLALSSRNRHLSAEGRQQALVLSQALQQAQKMLQENRDIQKTIEKARALFREHNVQLEYFEVVDAELLKPVETIQAQDVVICTAAYVEGVRLIDNVLLFS